MCGVVWCDPVCVCPVCVCVKFPDEVETKVGHHDGSVAQNMMDEQRTALTAGPQEPPVLVEDESCTLLEQTLQASSHSDTSIRFASLLNPFLITAEVVLFSRPPPTVIDVGRPATAHNHMVLLKVPLLEDGQTQLDEYRAQCMESNVHNTRIADCLAPLQYQRELLRCLQDTRQQSPLLFSIAQEPPSSFLPSVMVVFALPGLAFHGVGWLTCKDVGLVLLLRQGMKGEPRKAFRAITQRCNLLRSVTKALFTQRPHANLTSGLMLPWSGPVAASSVVTCVDFKPHAIF